MSNRGEVDQFNCLGARYINFAPRAAFSPTALPARVSTTVGGPTLKHQKSIQRSINWGLHAGTNDRQTP